MVPGDLFQFYHAQSYKKQCSAKIVTKMINSGAMKIMILLWATLAFSEAFISDSKVTRTRRQAKCEGFTCEPSRKCIDADKECDGTVNCVDGSDEDKHCGDKKCPPQKFRCNYGACINPEFECDGKQDCRDRSDETSRKCENTTIRQCNKDEFQCAYGPCIARKDFICDGVSQCYDNSDESQTLCGDITCPGTSFQCDYGACVSGDAPCNGMIECRDRSDENIRICGWGDPAPLVTHSPVSAVTPTDGACILPAHPSNGQWKINERWATQRKHPGDIVSNLSVLNFTCNENHIIAANGMTFAVVACSNGQWSPGVISECIKICPRIPKKPHVKVTCTQNSYLVDCNRATNDTIAAFECEPFYESDQDLALTSNRRTCENGLWNAPPINCIPKCGVRGSEAEILIVNGTNATAGDWPWHVGLYSVRGSTNDKKYICGGTLIKPYTILTAAHCLTNDEGVPFPKTDFIVAAGKHYRGFDDARDLKTRQISKLKEMNVHPEYRGYKQNFLADIALLTTETAFVLTKRVQPVCYDQSGTGDGSILNTPGREGYVVGWGHTVEDGSPADALKQVAVPYVPNDQCEQALPEDFDLFLTGDKICGGYLNKGIGVCKGDSGGGLVFKSKERGRYFVRAIVSVAPKKRTGGCDSQHYSLYTRLHSYNLFIYQKSKRKP